MKTNKATSNVSPKLSSSWFSKIYFLWLVPICRRGYAVGLEVGDLYDTLADDVSENLGNSLELRWFQELKKAKERNAQPSLRKAIIRCFLKPFFVQGALIACDQLILKMIMPLLMGRYIATFERSTELTASDGFFFAASLIFCQVLSSTMRFSATNNLNMVSMRMQIACRSLIYRKILRLSNASLHQVTAGEIVNLMSTDVGRFETCVIYLHYLWVAPLQVSIMTYIIWRRLGVAALVGVTTFIIIVVPVMGMLSWMITKLRYKMAFLTDNRIKIMNQVLMGIQVIKMYAWETPFAKLVSNARARELKPFITLSRIRGVMLALMMYTERLAIFVVLSVFVLMGNQINSEIAFSTASFFSIVQLGLAVFFPVALSNGGESLVAIRRMQAFLMKEENTLLVKTNDNLPSNKLIIDNRRSLNVAEKDESAQISLLKQNKATGDAQNCDDDITDLDIVDEHDEENIGEPNEEINPTWLENYDTMTSLPNDSKIIARNEKAIEIINVNASWQAKQIVATLSGINLTVKTGQLIGVVGPVGAGKSSLFQLILRELPLTSGQMNVEASSISYCSQEAWLFQSTIRNNILFGLPYDEKHYKATIRVCALRKDFDQLPYGDRTMVGARGSGLSGGQRARINLARAIYRRTDIYLLDDPLSAVDARVARHLYELCVLRYLAHKTRILVTHHMQYLKEADIIIVLNNGRIERRGTWEEISKNEQLLKKLQAVEEENKSADNSRRASLDSKHSRMTLDSIDDEEPEESDELIEKGSVRLKTYLAYFRAGGSVARILFVMFLVILSQVFASGVDIYLPYWIQQEQLRHNLTVNLAQQVPSVQMINVNNKSNNYWPIIYNDKHIDIPKLNTFNLSNISNTNNFNLSNSFAALPRVALDTSLKTQMDNSSQFMQTDLHIMSQTTGISIYAALVTSTFLVIAVSYLLFYALAVKASQNLHDSMFANIIVATMRFFDTNPTGRILNRFSRDIATIDDWLPISIVEAVVTLLYIFGVVVMVIISNAFFSVLLALTSIIFWILKNYYVKLLQDLKRLEGTTRSPMFSHVVSSMDGIITIRASEAENLVRREFDSHQDNYTRSTVITFNMYSCFGLWMDLVSTVVIAIIALTFLTFYQGIILSEQVGLAITQAMLLTSGLQYGIRVAADAVSQMVSVERVLQYLKVEKEGPFDVKDATNHTKAIQPVPEHWPRNGKIEFRKMYLSYAPDSPPTLKDLCAVIDAGSKVGIVGRTGAGKSSMIAALFRLAPIEGDIFIDDVSIKSIGLNDLRRSISIIPQNPVLFSASLRYNLDPFNKASDEEIWKALEQVEQRDIASSLEFKVDEGGANLSVGQRQLLCLARAILRRNKVLILDEATANVDHGTDALIQTTIRKSFSECTVLTIAHRLNTIIDSDKVIVLDAGKIIEYDHPHILLQNEESSFAQMLRQLGANVEQTLSQQAKEAYLTKFKDLNAPEPTLKAN